MDTAEKFYVGNASASGELVLDVTAITASVTVVIDPAEKVPSVRIRAEDSTSARAARSVAVAMVSQKKDRLIVDVPSVPGDAIVINDNVQVTVTAPPGSSLVYRNNSGSLRAYGKLRGLKASSTNGTVSVASVEGAIIRTRNGDIIVRKARQIDVDTTNGRTVIDEVSERLEARSQNGSITVGNYSGKEADLISTNGALSLTVADKAAGKISLQTHNGAINLYGKRRNVSVETKTINGKINLY